MSEFSENIKLNLKNYKDNLILLQHNTYSELELKNPGFELALNQIRINNKNKIFTKLKKDYLEKLLITIPEDNSIFNIALACFNASRNGARCIITEQDSDINLINFNDKCIFEFNNCNGFQNKNIEYAIAVDGYIETVAEVNRLLTSASELGKHCLILCRGYSDEVKNTIDINNSRNNFILSILDFKLTEYNVNVFSDLSLALDIKFHDNITDGLQWVLTGFSDITQRNVSIQSNTLIVLNPHANLNHKKSSLIKQMSELNNEFMIQVLQKRLANLGNTVIITFANNALKYFKISTLITMLRKLDDAIKHGVIINCDKIFPANAYLAAEVFFTSL